MIFCPIVPSLMHGIGICYMWNTVKQYITTVRYVSVLTLSIINLAISWVY